MRNTYKPGLEAVWMPSLQIPFRLGYGNIISDHLWPPTLKLSLKAEDSFPVLTLNLQHGYAHILMFLIITHNNIYDKIKISFLNSRKLLENIFVNSILLWQMK